MLNKLLSDAIIGLPFLGNSLELAFLRRRD